MSHVYFAPCIQAGHEIRKYCSHGFVLAWRPAGGAGEHYLLSNVIYERAVATSLGRANERARPLLAETPRRYEQTLHAGPTPGACAALNACT